MVAKRVSFLLILAAALVIAGCPSDDPDDLDGLADLEVGEGTEPTGDAADFKDAFMKTFEIEQHGGIVSRGARALLPVPDTAVARATWPADAEPAVFGQGGTDTIADYPEIGLTTSYVMADASATVAAGVWFVTVTTTYPSTNLMDTYVESYYVRDVSPGSSTADGEWTDDDPIVDSSNVVDPSARVLQQITFADGSVRTETIVKYITSDSDEDGFAAFDINGSLDYPDFSYPATDANARFSSIIVYRHEYPQTYTFTFWQGAQTQDIVGVRYYTEHPAGDGTQTMATMVAYEKAISTFTTWGGTLAAALGYAYNSEQSVLAESVFRKEVLFSGSTAVDQNSIMRSHVVDATDRLDFQLQILNDDVTRLLEWDGTTYFIPEGQATQIESTDPESEVLRMDVLDNPEGSDLATIIQVPGDSDLAALYTAIINEAVTQTIDGTDISGTLDGVGSLLSYSGAQGTTFTDTYDLTSSGTVEAWVYVNTHVNYAGIVHKGELSDFSDEAWSLQFVSARGDVAFALVRQSPSYAYIIAQSPTRLNTGRWYYLVATWDETYVTLYVDGVQKKRISNTIGSAALTDGPIVVGSQLYDGTSSLTGFYGFTGKINAVKVAATARTAAEIAADYTTYASYTASW